MLQTAVFRRITDTQLSCQERDCTLDSAFDRPKFLDNAIGYCQHAVIAINHYFVRLCFNIIMVQKHLFTVNKC
jgi:hypothetical protein